MVPVLIAIAFGGVDIGSIIAILALTPITKLTITRLNPSPAIPEVARLTASGINRVAVTVFDKKLDIKTATAAKTMSKLIVPKLLHSMLPTIHSASPVLFIEIPREIPPATSHRTSQGNLRMSSFVTTPVSVRNTTGIRAMIALLPHGNFQ